MTTFRAFTAGSTGEGHRRQVVELGLDDLPPGDVTIKVAYSGINYKDGLAASEKGRVARIAPLIPGVDLAGEVVASTAAAIEPGQLVIVHGYDLGVAHHGGYAGFARVPATWVVPMPPTLTTEQAMLVGTAGYTAALSVEALERAGIMPESGPILVTGATGGVGSMAVGMLARNRYEVVASTGKPEAAEWLRDLGASDIIDRASLAEPSSRPLESERWAGAVDCVGGATLATILRTLRYAASVAASGLTGGGDLPTTVFPFILRGVNLLGIDSVHTPLPQRIAVWKRVANDLRPPQIDRGEHDVIGLDDLPGALDRILAGAMRGRVVVNPW